MFLKFFLGEGFFCLFLGLICFDTNSFLSWGCSVLFFIASLFYIILGVRYRNQEALKFHDVCSQDLRTSDVRSVDVQQNQAKV